MIILSQNNVSKRSFKELSNIGTFAERFEYLKLNGQVAYETFGAERYLNQILYQSPEWRKVRRDVILRDAGCDLGDPDHPIDGKILIHHINPITVEDVIDRNDNVFDPDNLITTTHNTHNAIHYGNKDTLAMLPEERKPNDTCPWLL